MRISTLLSAAAVLLPLTEACYRTHGTIQQYTNTVTFKTTYLPSIYLTKNGQQICDGAFDGEKMNPYQPEFTPGGIPTNTSFSGPWGAYNCSNPLVQVDVMGVLGQVLVRDYETAFWINPEGLAWSQPASGQGLAGIANTIASYWTFDSGDVHC